MIAISLPLCLIALMMMANPSSCQLPPSSYVDLARYMVPLQFRLSLTKLTDLSAESRPDGVKALRYNLLLSR